MSIKIITDTGCDLPVSIIEEMGIDLMPLMVYLDGEEYRDGIDISHEDFYRRMREGATTRTAQVLTPVMEETFLKNGAAYDHVIYISFSSNLSGTYQTAVMVANDLVENWPSGKLTVIDSKCASIGFGLVVYKAAKDVMAGLSVDDVVENIKKNALHMEHIFTVDNLEYLYRGGRVSRGAAVVGSMLKIKPILDVEDGALVPLQKIRSRKKAIGRMLDLMAERGTDLSDQVVAINHGDDLETALAVKAKIQERFGVREFIINFVGCAIGAHSGPGTLSVFFINENKSQ